MAKKKPTTKKPVNWDAVRSLYKLGTLSLRAMADQYKQDHVNSEDFKKTVSSVAIMKEAKRRGWKKNLAGKVKARVKEKLVNTLVNNEANLLTDEQIVEEAAEAETQVIVRHRAELKQLIKHEKDLLKELEQGPKKVHISAYQGAITKTKLKATTAEKSVILKNLTDVIAKRIALEREIHNITGEDDPTDVLLNLLSMFPEKTQKRIRQRVLKKIE